MKLNTRALLVILVLLVLTTVSTGNISPGVSDTASTLTNNNLKVVNLRNLTYQQTYITWKWNNPSILTYSKISVYVNGQFKKDLSRGVSTYTASQLTPNTEYTISTRVTDKNNVISNLWNNRTTKTKPTYQPTPTPAISPTPPPTPTPTVQPPSQRKYSIKSINILGMTFSYCINDPNGQFNSYAECASNI